MADRQSSYADLSDSLIQHGGPQSGASDHPISSSKSCAAVDLVSFEPCDIDRVQVLLHQIIPDFWASVKRDFSKTDLLQASPPSPTGHKVVKTVDIAPLAGRQAPGGAGEGVRRSVTLAVTAPGEQGAWGMSAGRFESSVEAIIVSGVGPCRALAHPHITLDPVPSSVRQKMPIRQAYRAGFPVFSEPVFLVSWLSVQSPLAFLQRIWGFADLTRSYHINLRACGIRDQRHTVEEIDVTIDVHPDAVFTLAMTLPAIHEMSRTYRDRETTTRNRNGSTMVTRTDQTGHGSDDHAAGVSTSVTKTQKQLTLTRPDGTTRSIESSTVKGVRGTEDGKVTRTARAVGDKTKFERQDETADGYWPGFAVALKYNDAEIGGSWKEWKERIAVLRTFFKTVQDLESVLNHSFQFGWKVSGSLKGLEGSFKVAYGLKMLPETFEVGTYLSVEASILLVEASITASFGLALAFGDIKDKVATSDWAQLVDVRLSLTAVGGLTVKGVYERLTGVPDDGQTFELGGEVTITLQLVIQVARIISVIGKLTGGIEAAAKFGGTLEQAPVARIGLEWKPIVASMCVKGGPMKIFTYQRELMARTEMMEPIDFLKPGKVEPAADPPPQRDGRTSNL